MISIHAPRVGSDPLFQKFQFPPGISIHAPRVGSDMAAIQPEPLRPYFNPRSPCGERRYNADRNLEIERFQSTLPVWGATNAGDIIPFYVGISIHAPRVGSDHSRTKGYKTGGISIHAPRVGSDDAEQDKGLKDYFISIHAPRVGSDSR